MDEYEDEGLMHRPEKEIKETQVEETKPYVQEPIQKAQVQRKQTASELWADAWAGERDPISKEKEPNVKSYDEKEIPLRSQEELRNDLSCQKRDLMPVHNLEDRLDQFEVIGTVGKGGVATVKHVRQEDGTDFAYKHLDPLKIELAKRENPQAHETLLNLIRGEIKLINKMGQIDPEHFPKFAIDYTSRTDMPGFLTEFFPEESLGERLGDLEPNVALGYIHHAIMAMSSLHKHNEDLLCLGDTTPFNFMKHQGRSILVDLNLRYETGQVSDESLVHSLGASMIGDGSNVKGAPRYLAPEQWKQLKGEKDVKIDERVDVFQLGALTYEVLTGVDPKGKFKHLREHKKDLRSLGDILEIAMAEDPNDRYATVDEFLTAFRQATGLKEYNPEDELTQARAELKKAKSYSTSLESRVDALKNKQQDDQPLEVKVSNWEVASRTLGTIRKAAETTGFFAKNILTFPFAAATAIQNGFQRCEHGGGEALICTWAGSLIGSVTGVAALITNFDYSPATILLPLAATNAVSGIYELARHHKKKLLKEKMERLRSSEFPEELKLLPNITFDQYDAESQRTILGDSFEYEIAHALPNINIEYKKPTLYRHGKIDDLSQPKGKRQLISINKLNGSVMVYQHDKEELIRQCAKRIGERYGIEVQVNSIPYSTKDIK